MEKVRTRTLIILYLIITLVVIWGLALLKISLATTEVNIFLDDGDYFFVDEDGEMFEPLEVHLDSKFNTLRTAIQLSWALYTILTVIVIWFRAEE